MKHHLRLLLGILALTVIATTTSCSYINKNKLEEQVKAENRDYPCDLGMMGTIEKVEYDRSRNEVQATFLTSAAVPLSHYRDNQSLLHKTLLVGFSSGESRSLVEHMVKAKASLAIKYQSHDTGETLIDNITLDELRNIIDNPATEEDIALAQITQQTALENARCPYEVEEGITMTHIFDNGTEIVYEAALGSELNIDLLIENKTAIKENIRRIFNDPSVILFARKLLKINRGVSYRYVDGSGRHCDIVFTPAELRTYCTYD